MLLLLERLSWVLVIKPLKISVHLSVKVVIATNSKFRPTGNVFISCYIEGHACKLYIILCF